MTALQALVKRVFDVVFAAAVLIGLGWLIALAVVAATLDTGRFGIFRQIRIGRDGRPFRIYKVRTMRDGTGPDTNVTAGHDPRITALGRWLRRLKIDELPQFLNVLLGDMSVVGPRPDVPGFADRLAGADRVLLTVRPGVTGPAALVFRDEEELLSAVPDPERFSDEVLWPLKVRINRDYVEHFSFQQDLRLIADTVVPSLRLSRALRQAAQLRRSLPSLSDDLPTERVRVDS
ncbi:MAG: sugar transferase [Longimicrobiales bacterium]